jgi:hypothetical protein
MQDRCELAGLERVRQNPFFGLRVAAVLFSGFAKQLKWEARHDERECESEYGDDRI